MIDVEDIIAEHQKAISGLISSVPKVYSVAERMINSLCNSGTIFWMGNGGSAADAQHMAAELIGRFQKERSALSSIALTTDTSILTALTNDYDYSIIFSRQLEALCKKEDVVVGITTSGNSKNILRGIEQAKEKGAFTVGFTGGDGGKLSGLVDICLSVPATVTARIQEAHILLGHILCQLIEEQICNNKKM